MKIIALLEFRTFFGIDFYVYSITQFSDPDQITNQKLEQ